MQPETIEISGARQHNLRIDHLVLPKHRLVVFTGVSGSGKSSLAFDTLYAEGQRRYVESLSSYARQFLGQLDKPAYDRIRGLSPTIAIEQKTASSNPRSTVGTITEIYDYLRVLYARIGDQHCPSCGRPVAALSTQQIMGELTRLACPILLLAPLVENRKGEFREVLADLQHRGFVRVRVDGKVVRLDEGVRLAKTRKHDIELVVDRLHPSQVSASHLADSVETALREGNGSLIAQPADGSGPAVRLSRHRACSECGIGLPELSPQSFSFNSPLGMCPACNGLGRRMEMDAGLVVPDPTLSLRQGAIEPFASSLQRGEGWTWSMFQALEKQFGIDFDRPWKDLPAAHKKIVLNGTGDTKVSFSYANRNGRTKLSVPFEGVLNTLMRRSTETQSEQMRQFYMKYFSEAPCSDCHGDRLRPESRAVRLGGLSIAEVSRLSVADAWQHFRALKLDGSKAIVAAEPVKEVISRLEFLRSVGLDYLNLNRGGPSLSGGEAQRIRLASQLGSELSGVMYVLD